MSLDKFLSGTPSKKKKKGTKSSKSSPSSSFADTTASTDGKKDKKSSIANDAPKPVASTPISTSVPVTEPEPLANVSTEVVDTPSPEPVISEFDNAIPINEFKNKSKFELFQIIQELVQASPSYIRNKNLLAQLLTEKKYDSNPEVLAEQLEISYYEVVVLLAEITNDFENS